MKWTMMVCARARGVAIVALWEWRFFKEIEAAIKAGRCLWEEANTIAEAPLRR